MYGERRTWQPGEAPRPLRLAGSWPRAAIAVLQRAIERSGAAL